MNSSASLPETMPPEPITGIFTAPAASQQRASASGFTAGPERPPVALPRRLRAVPPGGASDGTPGARRSRSIASPTNVFTAVIASAPPRSQARAVSRMSVTSGDSLAMSGFGVSGRSEASVFSSRAGSAQ